MEYPHNHHGSEYSNIENELLSATYHDQRYLTL